MADMINISSEYDLIDIFKNIGKKYFPEDLSDQRIGMFGYVTEAFAHMVGSNILDSSIRSYEYNTITAKKMDTLMYDSSIYNLNITNATPPTVGVYLSVPLVAITGESYEGGFGKKIETTNKMTTYMLVLEKYSTVTIQNYTFMLEYDIQITATKNENNNGKYSYSVKYLSEGDVDKTSLIDNGEYIYPKSNTITELGNKYIPSYIQTSDNGNKYDDVLMFPVTMRQMKLNSSIYPITQNDIVSLSNIEFLYDDQLAFFNVYYKLPNSNVWTYIKPIPIYDISDYSENTIQYEIDSINHKLTLSTDKFSPAVNSEIRVDIYSTLGTSSNTYTYTGDSNDIIVAMKSLDDRHNYTGLPVSAFPYTEISGGKDIPTMSEIKKMLVRRKSSLASLNTEYDLLNYIASKDSLNDYSFIKRRSDMFKRIYSAFSILRDTDNNVLRTSTLPYVFNESVDDVNDFVLTLKAGYPLVISKSYKPLIPINKNEGVIDYYNVFNNEIDSIFSLENIPTVENADVTFDGDTITISVYGLEDVEIKTGDLVYNTSKGTKFIIPKDTILKNGESIIYKINSALKEWKTDDEYKLIRSAYDTGLLFNNGQCLTKLNLNEVSKNDLGTDVYAYTDKPYKEESQEDITIDDLSNEKTSGRESTDIKIYASPYTISCKRVKDGNEYKQYSSVFNTSYNDSIPLNIIDSNSNTNIHFASNSAYIYRNAILRDNKYEITLSILPNGDDSNFIKIYEKFKDDPSTDIKDRLKNSIMVKGFIYDNGVAIGYMNFDFVSYENSIYKFKGSIDVDDVFDFVNKKISSKNSIFSVFSVNDNMSEKIINSKILDVFNYYMSFGIYCLNIDNEINDILSNRIEIESPSPIVISETTEILNKIIDVSTNNHYPMFKTVFITDNENIDKQYDLVDVYDTSTTNIHLYTDMTDSVSINIELSQSENDAGNITGSIKELPVIQFSTITDDMLSPLVIDSIDTAKNALEEMDNYITNNFSFDYKFFRTYGPGRFFKLRSYNSESSDIDIGSLDISIVFKIVILPGVNIPDSEIIKDIRTFIKSKIETLTSNNEKDYTIYISNLITDLETNFSNIILSANLISINGNSSDYCVLYYSAPNMMDSDSLTKSDVEYYIPEFINISLNNITIDLYRYQK